MNVNINKITINLANAGRPGRLHSSRPRASSSQFSSRAPASRPARSRGHSRCSSCGRSGGAGMSPSPALRCPATGRRQQNPRAACGRTGGFASARGCPAASSACRHVVEGCRRRDRRDLQPGCGSRGRLLLASASHASATSSRTPGRVQASRPAAVAQSCASRDFGPGLSGPLCIFTF